MFGIGPMELVLILVVALLVLGPKRMPELARTLGRGLSEFRRASNDLRQSLALDDLQNDLRAGMSGEGSIRKPGDETDRPAQAGDDLPPGTGKDDASGEAAEQSAASKPHPGELPLDADPHAHHDGSDQDDADLPNGEPGDETAGQTREASAKASSPSETPDTSNTNSSPSVAQAKQATAKTADSPLGNVPVGGAPAPTDDRRG